MNQPKSSSKEEYEDCLPCRLTGAAAFSGLGIYAFREAFKLNKVASKQGTAVGLGVFGVVFLSAGLYRLAM
ncbi:hypothetical protein BCR43DRAFT_524285 [Syncephalastrum racemosum]|uniref:Distal membrane-arm assembly complex protein 1-like domain-containing protein n=1 Tax=Syncephalastrum racemosum TaxID=13706 RepID=A0A1X2HBG3_SYNRA|nr:hypothetical protein BCR43DRAFT_524285 [Syncephalastrum racemosum]